MIVNKRILIIKMSALGDLFMALPHLGRSLPELERKVRRAGAPNVMKRNRWELGRVASGRCE